MAHYAFLNENNIVVSVIPGKDECDEIDWEHEYSLVTGLKCKRTSYNTVGGIHTHGKEPFRKNYAGLGFVYIEELDIFLPPKPYASWVLDNATESWVAPVPVPDENKTYEWDDNNLQWVEIIGETNTE